MQLKGQYSQNEQDKINHKIKDHYFVLTNHQKFIFNDKLKACDFAFAVKTMSKLYHFKDNKENLILTIGKEHD